MSALEDDVTSLENAMRTLFQTMKRPQNWAHIATEAGVQIDRPAAHILHVLNRSGVMRHRVQDLASHLGVEAPSITRKTQELERLGYVERVADPEDKRAVCLQITSAGRDVSQKLWQVQRKRLSAAFAEWTPNERRQFVESLHRYSTELENQNDQKG